METACDPNLLLAFDSGKALETVLFGFTDGTDLRRTVPGTEIAAHTAPPHRVGESRPRWFNWFFHILQSL